MPTAPLPVAPRPGLLRRLAGFALRLVFAGAVIGGVGVAVLALHRNAGAALPPVPVPAPVAIVTVEPQAGHSVARRFAGVLEPARATQTAFERGGLIARMEAAEGDRVAAGDVLARLDTAVLDNRLAQLLAQRERLAAAAELTRLTAERQQALSAAAVSAQRLDETRLAQMQAESALVELDAALAGIEIDLAKSVLRAPFAGIVAARHLDEGAIVAAGAPVVELLEADRPRARIGLPADIAAGLSPGQPVTLTLAGRDLPARVAAIRPDLDRATRTVTALIDLDGPAGAALGDIVHLTLDEARGAAGAWLPLSALVDAGRGLWAVHTVAGAGDDLTVAREMVEVTTVAGDRVFVTSGLVAGARVIGDGAHRVIPGQSVSLAPRRPAGRPAAE